MIDNDGDLVNSFCFSLCVANKKEKKLKNEKKVPIRVREGLILIQQSTKN